jgi:hypothetical protein
MLAPNNTAYPLARSAGMRRVFAEIETFTRARASAAAPITSENGDRAAAGSLRREGQFWSVEWNGRTVRVRDSKGPRYLEILLRSPGREFHTLELVAAVAATETAGSIGNGESASLVTAADSDAGQGPGRGMCRSFPTATPISR